MIKSGVLAFVAFLALTGCANAGNDTINPALYVVRDADSTLYLYGSVHVRPAGSAWGDADVRAALDQADEIWTEMEISPQADAQAQALSQRLGLAPHDRPLSSWLSAEENARLAALTRQLGIPRASLESMQPWYAALALSFAPILRAGYDPQSGVDRAIDAYGDAHGKRMRWFETVEQQMSLLANLSPDLQRAMLREAIDENQTGPQSIADMTAAWEQGDIAMLQRLVVEDMRDDYSELYEVMFVRRNTAWMRQLTHELDGAGVDFVVVGAGHLIGPDGLVAQLRARGYAVERVGE